MNIEQLKNLLRSNNLKPNFTFGQNFLMDDLVLQTIVKSAELSKTDAVLEVGPGIGNLTKLLCEQSGFVLAIEKDPQFLPILRSLKKQFKNSFHYEIADILTYDFLNFLLKKFTSDVRFNYKVVANIPYYITGKILELFLTTKVKPESITILTQKEVAQGIVAKPGKLSVLAISVQLFGVPEIIEVVNRESFYPSPKVDSAILKITPHKVPLYKLSSETKFFWLLKQSFAGKRKQLHNTLINNAGLNKNLVLEVLQKLNLNPQIRPQELSIANWVELYNSCYQKV